MPSSLRRREYRWRSISKKQHPQAIKNCPTQENSHSSHQSAVAATLASEICSTSMQPNLDTFLCITRPSGGQNSFVKTGISCPGLADLATSVLQPFFPKCQRSSPSHTSSSMEAMCLYASIAFLGGLVESVQSQTGRQQQHPATDKCT